MRIALIIIALMLTLGAVVWDAVVLARGRPDETISRIVLAWCSRHPIVPFLLGVLVGHLLWPQRVP